MPSPRRERFDMEKLSWAPGPPAANACMCICASVCEYAIDARGGVREGLAKAGCMLACRLMLAGMPACDTCSGLTAAGCMLACKPMLAGMPACDTCSGLATVGCMLACRLKLAGMPAYDTCSGLATAGCMLACRLKLAGMPACDTCSGLATAGCMLACKPMLAGMPACDTCSVALPRSLLWKHQRVVCLTSGHTEKPLGKPCGHMPLPCPPPP
eukprot:364323-Chlamydomonas_euryale.AAC.19